MKIVFASNFYNHHQSEISASLHKLTGGHYYFVETQTMPDEQLAMGYGQERLPDYVLKAHKNLESQERCRKLINEADVVIAGSAPESMLRERIRSGKLLFRYAERPMKNGLEPMKYLLRLLRWRWRNPMRKPIYMLCASAFTAADYYKFGLFRNRCYKWGYFPEVKKYNEEELFT